MCLNSHVYNMNKILIFMAMISLSFQNPSEDYSISSEESFLSNGPQKIRESQNNNFKIKRKSIESGRGYRNDSSRLDAEDVLAGELLASNFTLDLSAFRDSYEVRDGGPPKLSDEDISDEVNLSLEEEDEDQLAKIRESLNAFQFPSHLKTCRTRDGRHLPPVLFAWDTCAHCYLFELGKQYHKEPPWTVQMRTHDLGFTAVQVLLLRNLTNALHVIEANASNHELFLTVRDAKFRTQWKKCCIAAIGCCEEMQLESMTDLEDNNTNYCPRTWDGWQCWKNTLQDTDAYEPCPVYSYIDTSPTCVKLAKKTCTSTGQWFHRNGREWTDYSPCGLLPNIKIRMYCHILALMLSVLALVPALLIFCWYRQLRVQRITLHKQLFASLLLGSCFTLTFRFLELYGSSVIKHNPIWCITLTMLRIYARQTNYAWYLCEGFYLHRLLASAFAKQRSLLVYYIIGWVLPLVPTGLYGVFRGIWFESTHCWNIPVDGLEWLIQIPPLLAMMVNLVFIVNVMRILLSKVKAKNDYEPYQFRMAVRATVMVIPLFGLQYIITIYRPKGQTCDWYDFYHILNNIIDGSTGLIVAIIFCFANNEVRTLCLRSWRRLKEKHETHTFRDHLGSLFRSRSLSSTVHTTTMDSQSATGRGSTQISTTINHTTSMNSKKNKPLSVTETSKSKSSFLSIKNNHKRSGSMPSSVTIDEDFGPSESTQEISNLIEEGNVYYIDENSKENLTNINEDTQDWNQNCVDEEFHSHNQGLL